ncbi:MAG TPA: hypothetical protein V6C76_00120 [Drouetiella sp.]
MISIGSRQFEGAIEFAVCFAVLALSAATLAICAPIALSIATVFLFAGPHNWIEARYFLSRLPARFGKYKPFFAWSFAGIAFLMASYIGIMCWLHGNFADGIIRQSSYTSYVMAVWNACFILWVVRLVQLSGKWQDGVDTGLALPLGFLAIAFACSFPAWFSLTLIYLHPFIGCWILDREMARSKPNWRFAYHLCLASIPFFLTAIFFCLNGTENSSTVDVVTRQIRNYAGAMVLPAVPSRMLVGLHTFLEIVHYGIWLVAIPLVSAGWKMYRPISIPLAHRADKLRHLVPAIFATSTFAVIVLWFCFSFNYALTRDVYFTLAMIHVLAEIPFLLKTLS